MRLRETGPLQLNLQKQVYLMLIQHVSQMQSAVKVIF